MSWLYWVVGGVRRAIIYIPRPPLQFVDWAAGPLNRQTVFTGIEGWAGWFLRYPLLFAQILLYFGIAWGLLLAELGLTDLYWNDGAWSQFWVGFGTAWLFGAVIFVNYLLNVPAALPGVPQGQSRQMVGWVSLFPSPNLGVYTVGRWMLCWLVGLLVLLWTVKAFLVLFAPGPTAKNWAEFPYGGGLLVAGYITSVVIAYLLTVFDSVQGIREEISRADWFQARFAQQDFNVPAIPPGHVPAPTTGGPVAGTVEINVIPVSELSARARHESQAVKDALRAELDREIEEELSVPTTPEQTAALATATETERVQVVARIRAERTADEVTAVRARIENDDIPGRRAGIRAAIEANREPHFRAAFANLDAIRQLHATALIIGIFTLLVLVFVFAYTAFGVASPAILLSMLLIAADVVGGLIAFRVRSVRTLGLLFVGFLFFLNSQCPVRHKMTFPNLDDDRYERGEELRLGCTDAYQRQGRELPEGGLINSEKWLEQFHKDNTRPDGSPPKLVIMAVSGGGVRASVWTGVVLEGLEEQFPGGDGKPNIRKNLRLFAGASGGMVGAAAYVGDFADGPLPAGYNSHSGLGAFSQRLAFDSLSPVVQTMMLRDFLWNPLIPKSFSSDRGRTLENSWDDNFNDWREKGQGRKDETHAGASPLTKSIRSLRNKEEKGECPSLIFSPMMVEDSKRLLISNLDLKPLTDPQAYRLDTPAGTKGLALPGVEFFRLFPKAENFRLGTAARMSATFPIVSPAVNLPTNPIRRVVDAGYFDNYGLDVIAHWLLRYKDAIRKHTSGVLIIQVRAYPLEDEGAQFVDSPHSPLSTLVASVSAPAEALLTARSSAAYHRNNELLSATDAVFNSAPQPANFLATTVFELKGNAALSWYLTRSQQRDIARGFYDLELPKHEDGTDDYTGDIRGRKVRSQTKAKIEAIREWLTAPPPVPPKGKP